MLLSNSAQLARGGIPGCGGRTGPYPIRIIHVAPARQPRHVLPARDIRRREQEPSARLEDAVDLGEDGESGRG